MLSIFWHSRTGASHAMAEVMYGAAIEAMPQARLIEATAARVEDFWESDGYIFTCPENLGTMSGVMKDMFDRCYYPLLGQIEGRPYATAIAAGSDGRGAEAQIDRIVTGWRLRRVSESLIINLGAQFAEQILADKVLDEVQLECCRELGSAMAEGLKLGIF